MKLISLESQNAFPYEDVSESNADMLELLLLHSETIRLSHAKAEQISRLYKVGHEAIQQASAKSLDDASRLDALSHGISTYEAVAALIRPQPEDDVHNIIGVELSVLTPRQLLERHFYDISSDARETFTTELPRTSKLIGQSASRFCASYSDYAITVAALARQLEIGAITEEE